MNFYNDEISQEDARRYRTIAFAARDFIIRKIGFAELKRVLKMFGLVS